MSITEPHRVITNAEIHVWWAALDANSVTRAEELDDEEKQRAMRFHFDRDRIYYIQTHSMIRRVLSAYTGIAPSQIKYDYGPHGKPSIAGSEVRFNLSHSAGLAAIGITKDREIGLDVEYMRGDIEFLEIAQRFFSVRECQTLAGCADSIQRTFYRIWTCKEAYMKARGIGLSLPSNTFDVCGNDGPGVLCSDDQDRWLSREFDPGFGCAGALVTEGGPAKLTIFDYAKEMP